MSCDDIANTPNLDRMKSNSSRSGQLREMLALAEQRARLEQQLSDVQERMDSLHEGLFVGGKANSAAAAVPPQPKGQKVTRPRKARRGALKEAIMNALASAGESGIKVKELATALGTKAVNIHSWFHSTTKRNPAIKKISGGHYRLVGNGSSSGNADAEKSTAQTKSPTGKRGRARGQKRGELSARIVEALQQAGDGGINVKDLAGRLGAKYKNIYIWFATTGKKNAHIKKVGPATYKYAGS